LRKSAKKAWNYRLPNPDAYKNAIKEYAKALRSKKRSSSTEDWLIASSVITEEKIRLAVNGFGKYIKHLVRTEFFWRLTARN
jgi:hypothetical protein